MDLQMLHKILESQDSSIANLADLIGMSKSNLYRCIREKSIKAQDLEVIAEALGVSVLTFFPPTPPEEVEDTDNKVAIGNSSVSSFNKSRINVGNSTLAKLHDRIAHLEQQLDIYKLKVQHLEERITDKDSLIEALKLAGSVQD
nr:MAG TPA: SOS-response transcriptional repressor [Caudoviricetes sp.]